MLLNSFFDHIQQHYLEHLPFVIYSKPESGVINGLLQQNNDLYTIKDYTESGFVFAPFNSTQNTVLIPKEHSESLSSAYSNIDVDKESKVDFTEENPNNKALHLKLVAKGVEAIQGGAFDKVVLSRAKAIKIEASPLSIFKGLLQQYPNAFVYCFYHPKVGVWLGATPETLIKVDGNKLKTMALAGTQHYKGNLEVSWSAKDKDEQQFVTDYIVSALKPISQSLNVGKAKTLKAASLLHICTDITARFGSRTIDLKQVLDTLHPTPAVCGLPKVEAKAFILDHENYDREYYTGFLGELNLEESHSRNTNRKNVENNAYRAIHKVSNLYVNLRCLQLKQDEAIVYVGGGITKDSNPEHEWDETVRKSETMISVLKSL